MVQPPARRGNLKTRSGRWRISRYGIVPAAGLILSSLLQGCAVGPNYIPPNLTLAPFQHTSGLAAKSTSVPPLDRWWNGFRDRKLAGIVERALAQNLDLAASYARVHEAQAAASGAGARLLPTVDLNAQAVEQNQSLQSPLGKVASVLPGYRRNQQIYDLGPAASWEVDVFGGLQRNAAAASAEAEAAEAERFGTRITIAAEAADAYMQIRGYQARLKVAREQIEVNTRLSNLVKTRNTNQIATDREAAQADALVRQARATVPILRVGLETQLNRLDVLLGAQPGTYARELVKDGGIPRPPAITRTSGPVDLLRRRPDIIAAERRLAASNERIGVAIADYYPKISLSGALGFESMSINHFLTARSFQPVGAGALRWRLFDFGKIDAEVAQATGANAEALALYRQSVLKATEDVEDAFVSLTQYEIRENELQGEVTSLTRSRDLSEDAYKAGAIPLTDVLDADRQLLTARDELENNRTEAARAAVRSFRALGGGWSL